MATQRLPERDSEELLMMFSTSPESPSTLDAARHPLLDGHALYGQLGTVSTAAARASRRYGKSTSAEISAFSHHSRAIPIGELVSAEVGAEEFGLPRPFGAFLSSSAREPETGSAPWTPVFRHSPPTERSQAISFAIRSNNRDGPNAPPPRSLDSTFSDASYITGLTSPSTSLGEDDTYTNSPSDQQGFARAGAKGKGKALLIDDILDSRPLEAEALGATSYASSIFGRAISNASPDQFGPYSPNVADLLPSFELERKAFDWAEFERSICSSPGAGTSLSAPFLPVEAASSSLGLTMPPLVLSPTVTTKPFRTNFPSLPSQETGVESSGPAIEPDTGIRTVAEPTINIVAGNVPESLAEKRRHAVSLYEAPMSDVTRPSTTVSIRPTLRSRTNSAAASIMSRAHTTGGSPKPRKRGLTLPNWLGKDKDGKWSPTPSSPLASHSITFSDQEPPVHKPRKLHKDKGRSHSTPTSFPFSVTVDGIVNLQMTEPILDTEISEADAKPVQQISLFDDMLPREAKLWIFVQLVIAHQEDFESRLKDGKWSVSHASRERWVGKDAGMRELIKLSRVSKSWQSFVLDGQLWQSFDLKAFPGLSSSLILRLAQCAGGFVQHLNLQGHSYLKPSSILAISSALSIYELTTQNLLTHTQLTTINLIGCTSLTTHSLHFLLYRSPQLKHLFLRGLDTVTNTTLTELVGPHCPKLITLDISRCSNVKGSGLQLFAEQALSRALERGQAHPLGVLRIAAIKEVTPVLWRDLGRAFPSLEVLDVSYCGSLTDECFREFVTWPDPVFSLDPPTDWNSFGVGVELTSRQAGLDPGDPTKYWRRITSLRHLNVSGCKNITDMTCTALAFTVPKLEILEVASVRGDFHDEGLLRLLKTTPYLKKLDLEDATELTDAVVDCLIPEPRRPLPPSIGPGVKEDPMVGEYLEHLTISYLMAVTPDAIARLVRGCKKLRVLEADNTRITGSIMRDFVNRRRHRERGVNIPEGWGSEIVGIDCRAVSEGTVKELRNTTRPRRGWRDWEARDLNYEDSQAVGVIDASGTVAGPLIGQDECDETKIVFKSFYSWVTVDNVAEQRAKLKIVNGGAKVGNSDLPRWLTHWSIGRRSGPQSPDDSPEEREDRGCVVQ